MFTDSCEIPNLRIKRVPSPFTPAEILEYLAFVQFTPLPTLPPLEMPQNWPDFSPTLANLEALMRRHLLTFPYENTEAHCTPDHQFSYRPRDVFVRLVRAGRGLGSVCTGHNALFKGILRGLGYLTAAGVNMNWQISLAPPKLSAMAHMINLVMPCDAPSSDYHVPVPHLVDVGYGGIGALSMLFRPLPLIHGATVTSFCAPEEHRLMRGPRPVNESSLQDDASAAQGWFLQARASPSEEWRTPHWFSTAEYTESDFEWISFSLSKLHTGPSYNVLACIKLHELPSGEIVRTSLMGARAVRKVGTRREPIEQWKWEEERIEAMKRLCGLCLEEREGLDCIRGRGVALPFRCDAERVENNGAEARCTRRIHSRL
ncbi:hypothetical protein HWV62_13677 [Athelia sp. TMB]|nr:hypothetical protein HWV62_13677 [Athelia sp. TMB]